MIVGGVFLAGVGLLLALASVTAPKWGERLTCGAASLALIMGGIALMAG